jgi:glycosyltransferase involved in cell wall biosynthesis
LPVVVSERAGCAEDLLRKGAPHGVPDGHTPHGHAPDGAAPASGCIRQNGFSFDPRSVDSLTQALLALDADPALRARMGQASRAIVADFSCEKFAQSALLAAQTALGQA